MASAFADFHAGYAGTTSHHNVYTLEIDAKGRKTNLRCFLWTAQHSSGDINLQLPDGIAIPIAKWTTHSTPNRAWPSGIGDGNGGITDRQERLVKQASIRSMDIDITDFVEEPGDYKIEFKRHSTAKDGAWIKGVEVSYSKISKTAKSKPKARRSKKAQIHPPFEATVYRVLIASPSDVVAERDAIEEVINNWNIYYSEDKKAVLVPIRWEKSATPETGDAPQNVLNHRIVSKCNILVGVFWGRIGSKTKNAESGTVEEIEQFVNSKRPAMLYFSDKSIPPSKLDRKQYEKLTKLQKQYRKSLGIIGQFNSVRKLKDDLMHHLTATLAHMVPVPLKREKTEVTMLDHLERLAEINANGPRPEDMAARLGTTSVPAHIEEWRFREKLVSWDGTEIGSGLQFIAVCPPSTEDELRLELQLGDNSIVIEVDHIKTVRITKTAVEKRYEFLFKGEMLLHVSDTLRRLAKAGVDERNRSVSVRLVSADRKIICEVDGDFVWQPIKAVMVSLQMA